MEAVLHALRADAARRTGLPEASLAVRSVDSVTWRDGALGCPEPGRLYPQVLVPGYRVTVTADGVESLVYHVNARNGAWVQCPAARATPPLPPRDDPRV